MPERKPKAPPMDVCSACWEKRLLPFCQRCARCDECCEAYRTEHPVGHLPAPESWTYVDQKRSPLPASHPHVAIVGLTPHLFTTRRKRDAFWAFCRAWRSEAGSRLLAPSDPLLKPRAYGPKRKHAPSSGVVHVVHPETPHTPWWQASTVSELCPCVEA